MLDFLFEYLYNYKCLLSGDDFMLDIIKDTLIDGIKLLPFLFIAFLIIELVEHKLSNKKSFPHKHILYIVNN